jgi:hypothetical protein
LGYPDRSLEQGIGNSARANADVFVNSAKPAILDFHPPFPLLFHYSFLLFINSAQSLAKHEGIHAFETLEVNEWKFRHYPQT